MLGLCFCARAFSSCGKRELLFIAVRRPLTIAASLVAEHKLQMCRLSSCGSRAQLLLGMWDLPRPGLEPVSPALAGRFSTTAPPGKPSLHFLMIKIHSFRPLISTIYLKDSEICNWFSYNFFVVVTYICIKCTIFFFKELLTYLFIYLFIYLFGCVGSLFLCEGFL